MNSKNLRKEEERLEKIRKAREFPLYIWTYKSSPEYIDIMIRVLDNILRTIDMREYFPIHYVGEKWSEGEFGSSEWYFEQLSKRENEFSEPQYSISPIGFFCRHEPWQKNPHIEIVVTGVDIWDGQSTNFIYGATHSLIRYNYVDMDVTRGEMSVSASFSLYPYLIISPYRMEKYYKNPSEIFELLAFHEAGHLFGLPNRAREGIEEVLGTHCRRIDCAMSQVEVRRNVLYPSGGEGKKYVSVGETWDFVSERLRKTGSPFCERCLKDLKENKRILEIFLFNV
jgi:hypothetical protein